jgi:hypothetical protein
MKKTFLFIVAMLIAVFVFALGVQNGDTYKLNGRTVTVHVGPGQVDGYPVNVTDNSGTSGKTVGISNDKGGIEYTTGTMCTGSDQYKVKGNRLYRKNRYGAWVDMGRPRSNFGTEGEGTLPRSYI